MSDPAPRGWFSPHPAAWLAAVVVGVFVHAALVAFPAVGWTRDGHFLLILGASGLCGAWVLTAVLWLFSDGARVFYHFVFIGFWGAFALGAYVVAREAQLAVDEALVVRLQEHRLALRQRAVEAAKVLREERVTREERLREDRFARYEGQVPAATLDQLRALDAGIIAGLREQAATYEAVLARHEVGGPSTWLRVATLDQLEDLRASHQAIYEASRAYNDHLDGLAERYAAAVEALALEPPADRFALAEMERLLQWWEYSGAYEIRRLDAEVSATALRALDLLRERWGAWKFDRANSRVSFDHPGDEFRFTQLLQEAEMLVREMAKLERQRERFEAEGRPVGR
jgi:hypothetical protein